MSAFTELILHLEYDDVVLFQLDCNAHRLYLIARMVWRLRNILINILRSVGYSIWLRMRAER